MQRLFFLVLLNAALLYSAWSGSTGKIAGRVIDATSKESLIGVNVIIEGTRLGAATDLEGR
ncbi:MAG: carboxypeptidase-like regulatory domain-containing protein, partial [Bacteroidota bacterium]